DRNDQHWPAALLLMTGGSVGIYLDEVALSQRPSENFLASGTAQVDKTPFGFAQRLDQVLMSELRHCGGLLNDQAAPIDPELDLRAFSDLHLLGDRGRDSEGETIAPLQDGLGHDSLIDLAMYSHSIYTGKRDGQASIPLRRMCTRVNPAAEEADPCRVPATQVTRPRSPFGVESPHVAQGARS